MVPSIVNRAATTGINDIEMEMEMAMPSIRLVIHFRDWAKVANNPIIAGDAIYNMIKLSIFVHPSTNPPANVAHARELITI